MVFRKRRRRAAAELLAAMERHNEQNREFAKTITQADVDRIRAHWKQRGTHWYEHERISSSPICDACNAPVDRVEDAYLNSSHLRCPRCTDKTFADALDRLRGNPDYFGRGLVQQLRASAE